MRQRWRDRAGIEERRDLHVTMRAPAVLDARMRECLIGETIGMEAAERFAAAERLLQIKRRGAILSREIARDETTHGEHAALGECAAIAACVERHPRERQIGWHRSAWCEGRGCVG